MADFSSLTALTSGRNPTGSPLSGIDQNPIPAIGSTSGQNPYTTTSTTTSGNAPVSTNPYGPVPVFSANGPGATSLTGSSSTPGYSASNPTLAGAQSGALGTLFGGMTQSGLNDMYHELNKTYGEGTASMIMSFLMSGAGFNQDAVNNLFAAMQPQIERGTQSIMEQFSETGNRFGSGAQIGLGDYLSQVNLNQGQLETQMYEQSVNDFINTLMGAGATSANRIAKQPSTWDKITSSLPIIGGLAQGASSAGVGGTLGSILDVIGSLA